MDKGVNIIKDADSKNIVLINDLRFKGRRSVDWNIVEDCLKEYIGQCAEITETSDVVYIGADFPDEFAHSKDTKELRGANMYAKANSSSAIKEMIEMPRIKHLQKIMHRSITQMLNSAGTGMTHVLQSPYMMMQVNWSDTMFLNQEYWCATQRTENCICMIF